MGVWKEKFSKLLDMNMKVEKKSIFEKALRTHTASLIISVDFSQI